jgi:hypothetical protein
MTSTARRALLAIVAVGSLLGGGVAIADERAEGTAYTCDALTSTSVPSVKKRLQSQGIDTSDVDGPIGLSCRKEAADVEGVRASVTGIEAVAYTCASAEDMSGTKVVFFVDCGPTNTPMSSSSSMPADG